MFLEYLWILRNVGDNDDDDDEDDYDNNNNDELFCEMVVRQKTLHLIFSQDHGWWFLPSQTSDTPRERFKPKQNLCSNFVELSCVVVITTIPR